MKHIRPDDGPALRHTATPMRKLPRIVYMQQMDEPFVVHTNEGQLAGHPGDYVAYDSLSGHVWPVAKDYVAMHYETATEEGE